MKNKKTKQISWLLVLSMTFANVFSTTIPVFAAEVEDDVLLFQGFDELPNVPAGWTLNLGLTGEKPSDKPYNSVTGGSEKAPSLAIKGTKANAIITVIQRIIPATKSQIN